MTATITEATTALDQLAASLGADLLEDTPANPLPHGIVAVYLAEPGDKPALIFSAGEDPATRLEFARGIVTRLAVTA
jgi:hypothetical protein